MTRAELGQQIGPGIFWSRRPTTTIYIYICIRGVTAHKIHGSVQYNIVVSWFGTFFDTGGGAIGYVAMLEIFLI